MATDAVGPEPLDMPARGTIRVLFDRVLVKRLKALDTFTPEGKIFQADVHKAKPQEAEVLAVGEGRFLAGLGIVPLPVKVGDRVIFGMHAGVEVNLIEGETVFILRAEEIMGIRENVYGVPMEGLRFVPAAAQGDGDPGSEG